MPVSKTQIDRLGDRLKGGDHTEDDLQSLDDYRRSFGEAYQAVIRTIRQRGESPTGRMAKSTVSIVEKLRRESIRLSQIQDIAGCRIIVVNVVRQDQVVAFLKTDFPEAAVIDRRVSPSYGYRAAHIIAEVSGKPIEIQVRSSLQHLWAELSEKASDILDPTIKYGGGPDSWRTILTVSSKEVAAYEKLERTCFEALASYEAFATSHENLKMATGKLLEFDLPDPEVQGIRKRLEDSANEVESAKQREKETRQKLLRAWNRTADSVNEAISRLNDLEKQQQ